MKVEVLLFVYGTLRRGEESHRLLARSRFVREARTQAVHELVDLGQYPAMLGEGSTAVWGEVFAVSEPTLAVLNRHEGHPELFQRQHIKLEDGAEVWAYVGHAKDCEGKPRIASGEYRRRA